MADPIGLTRQHMANGCYGKAFEVYLQVFERDPQMKEIYEEEFRRLLIRFNEILTAAYKVEEVFSNFHKALRHYPDNPHILNEIGKFLFHFGFYSEAFSHFQKALMRDAGLVNAEKNLNSVKNMLVERWHYGMLNDKIRNRAYHDAILQIVKSKHSVLDIGSGTGILSLYASEKNPISIVGIDGSEEMVKLSKSILDSYNQTTVVIVNGMSYDLNFLDIGGKRSVLITELFDAGLFGEHILKTLQHAHANLMSENGKVIPSKAEFFIIGAKCDHMYLKHQLGAKAKQLLNIPSLNVHISTNGETYDCEDIHLHKNLEYMTEYQSLIKINFNDVNDINMNLDRSEPLKIALKAIKSGEINVLIGWFNLYLTDHIIITTNPQPESRAKSWQPATAWQHAIFFDYLPTSVEENQVVNLEFMLRDSKLSLVPNPNNNFIRISIESLRFLNDAQYTNLISKSMGVASTHLEQLTNKISVVDLSPFPLFGLLMLKRGAQSLTCCAKTDDDKEFLRIISEANGIPLDRLKILEGSEWTGDVFENEKYHAICVNILDLCGDVDIRMREIFMQLELKNLVPGGLCLPEKIETVVQLAKSKWLDLNNRVYDENTLNYDIARHLNKYQVSQNFHMDLSCLEYEALSEPIVLGPYSDNIRSDVIDIPIEKDGFVNAILCWHRIEFMEILGAVITREKNSFINSTIFLANPEVVMAHGDTCSVIRCVDPDGSFKLLIDIENYN